MNLINHIKQRPKVTISVVLLFLSLLTWSISLQQISLQGLNDLGLIVALPLSIYFAFSFLAVGFVLILSLEKPIIPLLMAFLVAEVFILFGTAPMVQETIRLPIQYKLIGIIDYVIVNGKFDPSIDAFHNWPGFFILMGFVTEALGFESALEYAKWSPVFINILYLFPVYLLFRNNALRDNFYTFNEVEGNKETNIWSRRIWVSLWLFLLINWIGQDYLSPQGYNFFIYLTILAVLQTGLKERRPSFIPKEIRGFIRRNRWLNVFESMSRRIQRMDSSRRFDLTNATSENLTPFQTSAVYVIVCVLFAATVFSHQLTPVTNTIVVGFLVLFGRIRSRIFPLIMGVMILAWLSFGAERYFAGNIDTFVAAIGSVDDNFDANVGGRIVGSLLHQIVVRFRVYFSVAVWFFAFLGMAKDYFYDRLSLHLIILAGAPFAVIALQSYGGEIMLRVFMFASPFMAYFLASLFFSKKRITWIGLTALYGISVLLLPSFMLARHGNERMEYFPQAEIDAIDALYEIASPPANLVSTNIMIPWRYRHYNDYKYLTLRSRWVANSDIDSAVEAIEHQDGGSTYLIISRNQEIMTELYFNYEAGAWDNFELTVASSDRFDKVFENERAVIYELVPES